MQDTIKPCFPFPAEILLIITYIAAVPDFSPDSRNDIYAVALSICQVSKAVRRAALPAVLHTIVLPHTKHLSRFIAALHLQRHHLSTNSPLFIDYTKHIRKICIGEYIELPPPAPNWEAKTFDLVNPDSTEDDISVLTPVLLSAGSLGIDGQSLALLCHCLQLAWRSMTEDRDMDVDGTKNLPWRTSALTVFGDVPSWKPLKSTPEGLQFLASLSSVVNVTGTPDAIDSPLTIAADNVFLFNVYTKLFLDFSKSNIR